MSVVDAFEGQMALFNWFDWFHWLDWLKRERKEERAADAELEDHFVRGAVLRTLRQEKRGIRDVQGVQVDDGLLLSRTI